MSKRPRTLDSFFSPPPLKKPRNSEETTQDATTQTTPNTSTNHATYPFPIPHLPPEIAEQLSFTPAEEGRIMNDRPDLDLIYYQPYIPTKTSRDLFSFLRSSLPFYRVKYSIKRGPVETQINTPRWTTVFGVDETARFNSSGGLVDALTGEPLPNNAYPSCQPRPIPQCLETLRSLTENATGQSFNFCLVNYYADGKDSISYHSDDERFLGPEPAIASFTLGATRDFLLRHKKTPPSGQETASSNGAESKPLKLPLASGDMILMKGRTQANWEHSIPKRKGPEAERGRINITFRCARIKGGTANYYRYNVGDGGVFKWDEKGREMVSWTPKSKE